MSTATAQISNRENIHDLRNLFGIVASASHLLEDGPSAEKQALLLDAIAEAARRGGTLTTALLARDAQRMVQSFDLNERLSGLAALLDAQSGSGAEIRLELASERAPVKLEGPGFDAAILELVANARSALDGTGVIRVRTKCVGRRVWVLVADTGCGMTAGQLRAALSGQKMAAAHGTGLGRVRHFAEASHGRLQYRSREGKGTVAALALPLTLFLGSNLQAPPLGYSASGDGVRRRRRRA